MLMLLISECLSVLLLLSLILLLADADIVVSDILRHLVHHLILLRYLLLVQELLLGVRYALMMPRLLVRHLARVVFAAQGTTPRRHTSSILSLFLLLLITKRGVRVRFKL